MGNPLSSKLLKILKQRKMMVFIDAANLERSVQDMWVNPKDIPDKLKKHSAADLCWRVDYLKLKLFFEGLSPVEQVRFYSAAFPNDSHNKFLTFLKKTGIKLVTKKLKEYKDHRADQPHRKANFDVELSIDAVTLLEKYDILVLFSGDCDFEYLLKFARGHNKITIVFSRKGHIAKELPPASNYYFDLVDFRDELLVIAPKKRAQKIPLKRDSAVYNGQPND